MDKRIYRQSITSSVVAVGVVLAIAAAYSWHTNHAPQKLPGTTPEVSLLAVGDIMLSREVGESIRERGVDDPFSRIAGYVQSTDIAFGNMENPIVAGPESTEGQMVFHAQPGVENGIANAGFDVVSVANNHTATFGAGALQQTIDSLAAAGVAPVGAGYDRDAHAPTVVTRNGVRVAFLAYVDASLVDDNQIATPTRAGVAVMDSTTIQQDVENALQQASVVVVSMHAGAEYASEPTEAQVLFTHAAIDAGASVVIGSHPHVVQPVEEYKGKYILYSLGNFVFDQQFSESTDTSVMARIRIAGNTVREVTFTPIAIGDTFQPHVVPIDDSADTIQRLGDTAHVFATVQWDKSANEYKLTKQVTTNEEKTEINGMQHGEYTGVLHDGSLRIMRGGNLVWTSNEEWYVDSFAFGNVTGNISKDGPVQLTLSVWKPGNFGSSKPFWVSENDTSVKNHFFVMRLTENTVEPIWQSSNLEQPNCSYVLNDLDGDGQDELVVIEGEYAEDRVCTPTHVAVWKWSEWGLYNEWRSTAGRYTTLGVFGDAAIIHADPE